MLTEIVCSVMERDPVRAMKEYRQLAYLYGEQEEAAKAAVAKVVSDGKKK